MQYQEQETVIKLIRSKFIMIYLLNVTDLVFTRILISTGLFVEANIFMKPIISGYASIALKIGLVAILLIWLFYRIKTATKKQKAAAVILINICLILYILINISHLIWFAMLINKI